MSAGPRTLITGFGPFVTRGGHRVDPNPTAALCQRAAARIGADHAVLPVSFERCPQVLTTLLDTLRPLIWIGLGVAASRLRFDLEAVARNSQASQRGDADGACPDPRPVVPGGPARLEVTWDVGATARHLRTLGHDVGTSTDAGAFLCNQSLYLACDRQRRGAPPTVTAFVHVPLDDLDLDRAVALVADLHAHLTSGVVTGH